MRIAYGVHGYGRGHATRSMATLSRLSEHHEVLVVGGGAAEDMLKPHFNFLSIPSAGFAYGKNPRKPSFWKTFLQTMPQAIDVFLRGPIHSKVRTAFEAFQPDVVISDAEGWTHRVAGAMRIPRIAFDHFGIMANTRPTLHGLDRITRIRDVLFYKLLAGWPERSLISSFYHPPVRSPQVKIVPPLLRDEVFQYTAREGDHILVYINNGPHLFTSEMQATLQNCHIPMRVYGVGREGKEGNLEFKPPTNRGFLDDLSSCRAVVSTAGNQLIGETMYYQKPVLVMPEGCVEQRMNANAVTEMGVGEVVKGKLTTQKILDFLDREESFLPALMTHARDGRDEAIQILEAWMHELTGQAPAKAFGKKGQSRALRLPQSPSIKHP